MSYPVYTVYSGDVLPILFDTFDGGTGASITLTGLAVTDIEIYKDGSTTQRASDAGYTLLDTDGIDFDGVTGIHGFSIDTGDNSDAGFYAIGSWYHVVVSSVTIDAQTVNFVAAAFRIVAAETNAGVPVVDIKAISGDSTAADNLEDLFEETTAIGNLIDMFDGTGYAGGIIKLATDATLNATQGSYAPAKAGDAMTLTAAYDAAKTAAPTGAAMTLTSAYDAAKTAAQAGDAMTLADDAITSAKYDESTAFPVKSADTGATAIARTGADSDTLETLSDQIDGASTFNPASDAVTLAALQGLYAPAKAGDAMTLTEAYDAAKTAAAAGAKMDIVDAPNATGLAAIADAFLKRDWTSVTGEATRSVLNALRPLLNKWTSASGAGGYVVKKEDDSTTAWTGTLTVDENGNISGMDHD